LLFTKFAEVICLAFNACFSVSS